MGGAGIGEGVGIQWYLYVIRSDAYCCNMYIYKRKKIQWSTFFTERSPLNVSYALKRGKKQKLKGVLFAKVNETDFYQLPHIQFKNNFSLFLCV